MMHFFYASSGNAALYRSRNVHAAEQRPDISIQDGWDWPRSTHVERKSLILQFNFLRIRLLVYSPKQILRSYNYPPR